MAFFGLDFGTTNSALAILRDDQAPTLTHFQYGQQQFDTFRSILYFNKYLRDKQRQLLPVTGMQAIYDYLDDQEDGRLIQSVKSFLGTRSFEKTTIFGQPHTLPDLIYDLLAAIKATAEAQAGEPIRQIVVGRPVHFVSENEDEDIDEFALSRLREPLESIGFEEVVFELEPVGAAYHYGLHLDHDEIVLIGDFGGGTSDFCLIRTGPGFRGSHITREEVYLGATGIGLAGDALDRAIVRQVVAPELGSDADVKSPTGELLPLPNWIYHQLERWHHMSFLNTRENLSILNDLKLQCLEPDKLDKLIYLVSKNLGFYLHQAVERAKIELSTADNTLFELHNFPYELRREIDREEFEAWTAPDIKKIERCVDELFAQSPVDYSDVDKVFLTGGTSLVPRIRRIFTDRFGESRIGSGSEFTAVAGGLALRARDVFEAA